MARAALVVRCAAVAVALLSQQANRRVRELD